MSNHTEIILFLCFISIPVFIYLGLLNSYLNMITLKKEEIESITSRGNAIELYFRTFSIIKDDTDKAAKILYDLYYHRKHYIFPVLFANVTAIAFFALLAVDSGIFRFIHGSIGSSLSDVTKDTVFMVMAGAFVWSTYDLVSRYNSLDLTPTSFSFTAIRLIVALPLGFGIDELMQQTSGKLIIAFGIGAFPLRGLKIQLEKLVFSSEKLGFKQQPVEKPTLHHIQGLNQPMIDRLAEEGITSTEHLANADPIKLFFKTNIEWKIILDIIDQSILFNYIGEKIEGLRVQGLRGSIEVAAIGKDLVSNHEAVRSEAEARVKMLAQKLDVPETAGRTLVDSLFSDTNVEFVAMLWSESSSYVNTRSS